MSQLTDRMIRAARLEPALYEEVEADRSSMGQAMAVVLLASVASGIGNMGENGVLGLITGALGALVGWYVWAFLTYFIGTRLLAQPQTHADVGELLRTTGFSAAPGVLRVFGFVPFFGPVLVLVVSIWMLIAMIVAVRQALDYTSSARAVGVCLIGWIVMLVFTLLVAGTATLFSGGSGS
jgi:hypothetical protein